MDESFDQAMAVRRAVLGDDYVDAAVGAATEFTAPFQEFVTRWAWGEAWLDDTLDRQTRSLLTIAVVTVLGQLNEIRLHTRGAMRNGCTPGQIGSVLRHVAVYAGVAKAVAAVGIANEEIAAHTALPGAVPADGPVPAGSTGGARRGWRGRRAQPEDVPARRRQRVRRQREHRVHVRADRDEREQRDVELASPAPPHVERERDDREDDPGGREADQVLAHAVAPATLGAAKMPFGRSSRVTISSPKATTSL